MANESLSRTLAPSAKAFLVASILLLVVVSWVGVLDRASGDYVEGSFKKALVAFGTARAINGAISVAQSTTVSVGAVTEAEVSPGEILDPINDLVEDYSSVMKAAIVSLVIQKTLLAVVSETVFKVLLTLSGLALIASVLLKFSASVNFLFKIFATLIFLRFILVAVVLLNGFVNQAFIDEHSDEAMGQLEVVSGNLKPGGAVDSDSAESSPGDELAELQREVAKARSDLQELTVQLEVARSQRSLTDKLIPFREEPAYEAAASAVDAGKTRLNELLVTRCNAMRLTGADNAETACDEVPLTKRALIRLSSVGQAISAAVKVATSAVDVAMVRQKVEAAVEAMVTSMALFILQTMVLPLVFLLLLSRAMKSIWGLDLKEMTAKARSVVVQNKRPGLT